MSKRKAKKQCPVCFSDVKKVVKLPCKCTACPKCLNSWIVTKVRESSYSIGDSVRCMNFECRKPLDIQQITSQISKYYPTTINDALLQVYMNKSKDIRRCPRLTCKYAGVIDTSTSCSDNLTCSVCKTSWRERVHLSKAEIFKGFLFQQVKGRINELLCKIWKQFKTKRCPKCQTRIEKNGGCEHMTCINCKYEFCWTCFEESPNHRNKVHNYNKVKPALLALLTLVTIICLLILIYQIPIVKTAAEWTVFPFFYFLWKLVVANTFLIPSLGLLRDRSLKPSGKALCVAIMAGSGGIIYYFGIYMIAIIIILVELCFSYASRKGWLKAIARKFCKKKI